MIAGTGVAGRAPFAKNLFGYPLGQKPVAGGGGGGSDPRWADVKMLIDFTGQDGLTSITDVKNGEVYTLHGSAVISGGQYVGPDGYSWAETPDSPNHDIGEAPDTIEFKDVQFDDLIEGGYFHTLLSNMDGLTPTLGFGYNGGIIYFQYKDGIRWEFPFTPVLHQKYDLAWSREETTHIVRFFVDGVLQATTYNSPDPIITGSTRKMFIGALNYSDNPFSCLIGKIGAIRLTDGTPRFTASYTPEASFPHG